MKQGYIYNNIILFTAQYRGARCPQVGRGPWVGNRWINGFQFYVNAFFNYHDDALIVYIKSITVNTCSFV